MSRTILSLLPLSAALLAASAFAQGPAPEPCYEAETPILMGSFIAQPGTEQSGESAAAKSEIGSSVTPSANGSDAVPADRSGDAPPRIEPVKALEPRR